MLYSFVQALIHYFMSDSCDVDGADRQSSYNSARGPLLHTLDVCVCVCVHEQMGKWTAVCYMEFDGFSKQWAKTNFSFSFFQRTLKLFVHRQVAITNVSPSIQLLLVLASFTFLGSIFEARWRWNQFQLCVSVCVGVYAMLSVLFGRNFFLFFIMFVCSIHFHFIRPPPTPYIQSPIPWHTIEFSVYSFDHYKNRSSDTHWILCDCFDIMFLPFYLSHFMNAPFMETMTAMMTRTAGGEPPQKYGNRPTWENNIVH